MAVRSDTAALHDRGHCSHFADLYHLLVVIASWIKGSGRCQHQGGIATTAKRKAFSSKHEEGKLRALGPPEPSVPVKELHYRAVIQ
jgi:hypothetical protein